MKTNLHQLSPPSIYSQDFNLWIQQTTSQIRSGNFDLVDWENVLEELESLGKSDHRELKSRLAVLLMHLLKYKYQPEKRSKSWLITIFEQRQRIMDLLSDSPSLKGYLNEVFQAAYQEGCKKASLETDLPIKTFPTESPFNKDESLNPDYLPD
jgi:hypothetical protein